MTAAAPTGAEVSSPPPAGDETPDDAADLAEAERELVASVCLESLADFVREGWHVVEASTPLVWGPHLDAICAHVQALLEDWARRRTDPTFVQRMRDLLINIPPGTGKSRILAFAIPWAWLRWPELRAMCLSTNPRVALRDSMIAREVIGSRWYRGTFRPAWRIRDDADAKGSFQNTAGGWRNAMGIDARVIGERADLIVVDDPHDPEEAISDAARRSVLERWNMSIANRVNDLACSIRVGLCQRVHEDDWSAARLREGWAHLSLPMEHELGEPTPTPIGFVDWRTVEGESLHPPRFTSAVIAAERTRVGPEGWSALYQQRPTPAGGAMVKLDQLRFFRRPGQPDAAAGRPRGCWAGPSVELPETFETVTIAADLAAGMKTRAGDFNVIVAVGKRGSAFFLLDVWRARADFPEAQAMFRGFASRWPMARKVVEQAAAGGSLVTSLAAELPGLVSIPPNRLGNKVQRLHAVLAFFAAGNVHFDEYHPAIGELIAELTAFPRAPHDDFVDALTLALGQAALAPEEDAPMSGFLVHIARSPEPW